MTLKVNIPNAKKRLHLSQTTQTHLQYSNANCAVVKYLPYNVKFIR